MEIENEDGVGKMEVGRDGVWMKMRMSMVWGMVMRMR